MKNFLKYLILMVADLLAVGIVAGTVIRTIVYGIVGEENHHIYMIIRVTLIILIFFTGILIINYKNDDKRISFRDSKEISSVVNGNLTYREMILHNKLFKSEVISFVVFMVLLLIIMLPSMYRLGGILLLILDILITLAMIIAFLFINYNLTKKTLDTVVIKNRNLGVQDEDKNK